MAKRITLNNIRSALWATGRPTNATDTNGRQHIAAIVFAALKTGMDYRLALMIGCRAYDAFEGYTWKFQESSPHSDWSMARTVRDLNAIRAPNGRDAEERAAELEQRPSRWMNADRDLSETKYYPYRA